MVVALMLGVLSASLVTEAQEAPKVYRVGILSLSARADSLHLFEALGQGLRDRGYVEGRNITLEYRFAERRMERLPDLAAELVRLKVDLIVAANNPQAMAARQATSTIPIVTSFASDPVGEGLVASLGRPGGNITGLTADVTPETWGKCLQLLKELVPRTAKRLEILTEITRSPVRVAFLRDPAGVNAAVVWEDVQRAARQLNVAVTAVDAREAADVERALAQVARDGAKGLLVDAVPFLFLERRRIFEFTSTHRLPAVYFFRAFVDAGGLASYGPDFGDEFRRAAGYVDRILKGASPGDLPVEQPTKFDLAINLKIARALALTMPPALLLRADQVIE